MNGEILANKSAKDRAPTMECLWTVWDKKTVRNNRVHTVEKDRSLKRKEI